MIAYTSYIATLTTACSKIRDDKNDVGPLTAAALAPIEQEELDQRSNARSSFRVVTVGRDNNPNMCPRRRAPRGAINQRNKNHTQKEIAARSRYQLSASALITRDAFPPYHHKSITKKFGISYEHATPNVNSHSNFVKRRRQTLKVSKYNTLFVALAKQQALWHPTIQ